MHNALAVILSIFWASLAAASVVPPLRREPPSLDDKCTFTLWHKQVHAASSDLSVPKQNFIQINFLTDHTNNITIHVALFRPTAAFNSYSKISQTEMLAIEGLLYGTNLTVKGEDGSDYLQFESNGLAWTADGKLDQVEEGAWCDVGEWDAEGPVSNRVCC